MKFDLLFLADSFQKSAQLLQQQKTFQDALKHCILLTQQLAFLHDITSEIVNSSQTRIQKPVAIMRPDSKTASWNLLMTSKQLLQQAQGQKNITTMVNLLKTISQNFTSFDSQYLNPYKAFLTQNNFPDQWRKVDMMDRQIKAAITNLNNFLIAAPSTNTSLTPSTTPKPS